MITKKTFSIQNERKNFSYFFCSISFTIFSEVFIHINWVPRDCRVVALYFPSFNFSFPLFSVLFISHNNKYGLFYIHKHMCTNFTLFFLWAKILSRLSQSVSQSLAIFSFLSSLFTTITTKTTIYFFNSSSSSSFSSLGWFGSRYSRAARNSILLFFIYILYVRWMHSFLKIFIVFYEL